LGIAMTASLLLAVGCSNKTDTDAAGNVTPKDGPSITVGSANFTESIVLAEIYAQGLAAKGYSTSKKLNVGARDVYFPALEKGSIDFLPEYTGALLRFVTKDPKSGSSDSAKTFDALEKALAKKDVVAMQMADAQDKDGIVTNKQTQSKYKLEKVSDLKPVAKDLVMGGPPECPTRPSCLQGLEGVYGIHFKEFKPLDPSGPQTVTLLDKDQIQVANLFTTDGRIAQKGFFLLDDDKGIEVAQNVVPVTTKEVADAYGADLTTTVDAITGKLTTENLTALNKRVDIDHEDAKDVAKEWLTENALLD
jgi:osmoprotectant transport system substrate-binding protein